MIATSADAVSLDPAGSNDVPSSNIQENIYESLTKQDEDMEVQPSLATEWEAVEDNVWEFTLREDIKFQDRKSTRLNSSHVAISYAVFCLTKTINVVTKSVCYDAPE